MYKEGYNLVEILQRDPLEFMVAVITLLYAGKGKRVSYEQVSRIVSNFGIRELENKRKIEKIVNRVNSNLQKYYKLVSEITDMAYSYLIDVFRDIYRGEAQEITKPNSAEAFWQLLCLLHENVFSLATDVRYINIALEPLMINYLIARLIWDYITAYKRERISEFIGFASSDARERCEYDIRLLSRKLLSKRY